MGLSLWDRVQGANRTLQLQVCPSWLQKTRPVQAGQWLDACHCLKKYTVGYIVSYIPPHDTEGDDVGTQTALLEDICQVIAASMTFKIDSLCSFFFSSFQYKGPKKQVISYSIAVKNACFYWVIECIAPSMHALTARLGPLTWVV